MGPYQELSPSIESLQCTSPSHGSILFGTAFLSISGHFSNHMSLQIFLMGSKGSLTLTGPTFWCASHGPGGGLILAPLPPEASEILVLNINF